MQQVLPMTSMIILLTRLIKFGELEGIVNGEESDLSENKLNENCCFDKFTKVSESDVKRTIVSSSASSCELDPISTKLLKDNIDTLLPKITLIFIISLQN